MHSHYLFLSQQQFNMKTLLFIIPSLKTGGTNSSLDAMFSQLNKDYNISVFAISHQPRNHNYSFDEVLLQQDVILSLLFSNYTDQKGKYKLFAFFLKSLQSILRIVGIDLGMDYGKRVIRRLESQIKPDYVIAFQEGFATKFTSLFNNPSKIAWIHCNYNAYLPQGKSEEALYSGFIKIVCVSEYTSSVFMQRYPSLANHTLAIHNIIDCDRIMEKAKEPIDDPRFETQGLILLTVGRFSPVKRFREIPKIAFEIKRQGIRFRWYILGPQDNSKECDVFLANQAQYDVHDCVRWLEGKSNPYPYFKVSDLYVCLSESEACPMVFLEAKLFGLPIVTTDFPSAYEFVSQGEGAITSMETLSDAIVTVARQAYKTGFNDHVYDNTKVLERLNALFG